MSAPEFTPRPQLAEDVARFVRRRIFNGTYPAGEYIRLDQLAAELGISVTPVREALFELRGEGLLDQLPRRGFVVLPFTDRDITDVSNLQAHVGGELAARAAVNIDDAALAELSVIHDQLTDAYAVDDGDRRRCGSTTSSTGPSTWRGLTEAGAVDVADHPVCAGVGVSHDRGLAGAVGGRPRGASWPRCGASTPTPRVRRCRITSRPGDAAD